MKTAGRSLLAALLLLAVASCVNGSRRAAPSTPPPAGAQVLFDGHDTSAWVQRDGSPFRWPIEDGAMVTKGGDIETKDRYGDARIHVEFLLPKLPDDVKGQARGNSGVYIQGRYEIQILDSYGLTPGPGDCGAIYRKKAPDSNACLAPGQWQSYDIDFTAAKFGPDGKKVADARITVVQNGVKIHDNSEIPDKTGSGEAEGPDPRPLRLQDHGNRVLFRNVWIMPGSVTGNTATVAPSTERVTCTLTTEGVDISVDGRPFTFYHLYNKDGSPVVRPYFYPVLADDGTPVTSDQLLVKGGDHPHHRSIWISHGDVNGSDFWSITDGKKASPRQLVTAEPVLQRERPAKGMFSTYIDWKDRSGEIIMREIRSVYVYPWPDGSRAIDISSVFFSNTSQVRLADTKEAGMVAVRVVKALSDTGTITNSRGGRGESECWGKPAEWCDISGTIDGRPYGVAVMDDPENPRAPARWHVRQYGLLASNIFGLSEFDKAPKGTGDLVIQRGQLASFRHLIVIHRGDALSADLPAKYAAFAPKNPDPVAVFNGRDLSGWRVPSPNHWWTVENGMLVGQEGPNLKGNVLETEKEYGDAIVELDFRWKGDCDSGIFLRKGQQWQCQIGISRSLKREMTCSIYAAKGGYIAEAKDMLKHLKPGEWNRIRIEALGPHFRHWLNGQLVLDYITPDFPEPGPLGLQVHDGVKDMRIEFRNIKALSL